MSATLIDQLAEHLGIAPDAARAALDGWVAHVQQQLAESDAADVPGLGRFHHEAGAVAFSPGEVLSRLVNQRYAGLKPVNVGPAASSFRKTEVVEPTEEPPAEPAPAEEPAQEPEPAAEAPPAESDADEVDLDDVWLEDEDAGAEHPLGEMPEPTFEEADFSVLAGFDETRKRDEDTPDAPPSADEPAPTDETAPTDEPVTLQESHVLDDVPTDDVAAPADEPDEPVAADTVPPTAEATPEPEDTTPGADEPAEPEADTALAAGAAGAQALEPPAEDASPVEADAPELADTLEPADEKPPAEEPFREEPVAEEPVTEEPVTEEPVAEEPVAEAGAPASPFFEEWSASDFEADEPEPEPELFAPVDTFDLEPPAEPVVDGGSMHEEPATEPTPVLPDLDAEPPAEPDVVAPPPPAPAADKPPVRPRRPLPSDEKERSNLPAVLAGIVIIALIVVGGVWLMGGDDPEAEPPAVAQNETPPAAADPQPDDPQTTAPQTADETLAEPAPSGTETPAGQATSQTPPPAATGTAAGTGTIARDAGAWTLVVASWTVLEKAEAEARQYAQRFDDDGYAVDLLTETTNGLTRYRVGLGQFASRADAQAALDRHKTDLPDGVWLLRVRPGM